jgi:threonylcarbamoyladenosine tRNA methylthiotransferase MtaB
MPSTNGAEPLGAPDYCVVNLGCKVNRVESDGFAARLEQAGGRRVGLGDADVIVVNTCTVTGGAEKKTRKAVHRALRENSHARVVVTGCAAAIDPDVFTAMDPRVEIFDKHTLERLMAASPQQRAATGRTTRMGVKVQDGCDNACSYCIVHVARGKAVSRPVGEVVEEVRALGQAGVREMVLTGINLGSYRDGATGLTELLRLLMEAAPESRFRISSIEPHSVDDSLIDLLASSDGRVCRHLHLPLQSGSSRVLAEMNRPYDALQYQALVARMYERVPELSLSTDIIVGFPGETEQDFEQTLSVARACRFSKIHVFRYSRRAGTPAAERTDQVDAQVKAERAHRLAELARELRDADRAGRRGTTELVLVESDGRATTESYHTVDAPAGSKEGDLVPCPL